MDYEQRAIQDILDSQLAKAADLEEEYRTIYSITSKYVHGSALLTNVYQDPKGIDAIGQPQHCKPIAFLAVNYCTKILIDLCEFFGVDFDEMAVALWQNRLLDACKDVP